MIRSGDNDDYHDNADDDADDDTDDDNDAEVRWAQWRFCLQEASTTRPDQGLALGGGDLSCQLYANTLIKEIKYTDKYKRQLTGPR